MFRPGRILGLVVLGLLVYGAFYAGPSGGPGEGDFDPQVVALAEADAWRSVVVHEDVSVYFSMISMVREQHRYSWFRAAQAGFYLGRATLAFAGLHTKFERVLPDLEAAATIQKDWTHATFKPEVVARAQLDWWVALKLPNLNTTDQVSSAMAQEYAIRYNLNSDKLNTAALRRAEAIQLRDAGGTDPDWPEITRVLDDSYRALASALKERRPARTRAQ